MSQPKHKPVFNQKYTVTALRVLHPLRLPALLSAIAASLCAPVYAQQTATINTFTKNYWTGIKTNGNSVTVAQGTNFVTVAGGNTNITFTLITNNPILGPDLTNLATVIFTPVSITNSSGLGLKFNAVGPLAPGFYPLAINAYTNDGVSVTNLIASVAGINLCVGRQWGSDAASSIGNWSDGTMWVGGIAPASTESVYFENVSAATWTNVVDTSLAVQDLVYLRGGASYTSDTKIAPGATLSVLGTNGFIIGSKVISSKKTTDTFEGDTLVVSNSAAKFSVTDGNGNDTNFKQVDMRGLNNLIVYVDRMGIGDASMLADSTVASMRLGLYLAKTNVITALHTDDYTALDFNTSIQFDRQSQGANNAGSAAQYFGLGTTNAIFADSIGIGRGGAVGSGSSAYSIFGYQMRFVTQASAAPTSSAYFRNSDGVSRMGLVAVAVDSGVSSLGANTGVLDLRGGKVDMLVDQIWVARNRTNFSNYSLGGFYFDNGIVNANTVRLGYGAFTNNIDITKGLIGYLSVETNGTLIVNNDLNLGYTPDDVTGFEAQMGMVSGQVRVTSGGTLYAKQISVGAHSGANQVTVAVGGSLVVSNSIASASRELATLTLGNAANLTFFVAPGVTNVFVTNVTTTATAAILNIASAPSGPSTNVVIHYETPGSHNFAVGSLPPGITSAKLIDDGANIIVVLSTNVVKNLVWRGGQNSQWDHTSLNWLNTANSQATTFSDGDYVTFDDAPGVPTSIQVAEIVSPNQSGVGVLVTNSLNNFTFSAGAGYIDACSMAKGGTAALEIDASSIIAAQMSGGTFTIGAGGSISSAIIASGCTFTNLGTVAASVSCGGFMYNGGTVTLGLSVQGTGIVTNDVPGRVEGTLAMSSGGQLYNFGGFDNIGSPTIPTNAYIYNAGYLAGTGLTITGTLLDTGTGVYPPINDNYGVASSLAMGTGGLVINGGGTFIPGGDGIGTTTVSHFPYTATIPTNGSTSTLGLVKLLPGSTNIFKVNVDSGIQNTVVHCVFLAVGANQSNPLFNGSTIVVTNTGTTQLSAGQTFALFQSTYGGPVYNSGANTVLSYPLIVPAHPAPGLNWELHLMPTQGILSVINPATVQIGLTMVPTLLDGKVALSMSWPSDYIGGWLQVQTTTNGLNPAGAWSTVANTFTNNVINLTNNINPGTAQFYRFVYP